MLLPVIPPPPGTSSGAILSDERTTRETPLRHLFNTVVTVRVGAEDTPFSLHKDLLCSRSPFFNSALRNIFLETTTQQVVLPEDDVETFQYFIQWVYSKELSHEDVDDTLHPQLLPLYQLYAMADQFQVKSLKNAIIDYIVDVHAKRHITPEHTIWLYENVPEKGLRKLLVDIFAWSSDTEILRAVPEESYHHTFLYDLAVKLKELKQGWSRPWVDDLCAYHDHDSDTTRDCNKRKAARVSDLYVPPAKRQHKSDNG
ncbi:MAG: hypothetical protein M1827_006049 [Pycnora praestabilis]|nr:MAG: hypothetical protein M1827_006049 [Pycnora praestabilis]